MINIQHNDFLFIVSVFCRLFSALYILCSVFVWPVLNLATFETNEIALMIIQD